MKWRLLLAALCVKGLAGTVQAGLISAFTATPNPAAPNQVLTFDGTFSVDDDPARQIVNYLWDFDSNGVIDATGPITSYSYSSFGGYTASLTVLNDLGTTASSSQAISISLGELSPIADAGGPYSLNLGDDLILNGANSFDPNAAAGDDITSWEWDLNSDGQIDALGPMPTISASQYGSLLSLGPNTVRLFVTDTFGLQSEDTATLSLSQASTIPEPSSILLFGLGGLGLVIGCVRRRNVWAVPASPFRP